MSYIILNDSISKLRLSRAISRLLTLSSFLYIETREIKYTRDNSMYTVSYDFSVLIHVFLPECSSKQFQSFKNGANFAGFDTTPLCVVCSKLILRDYDYIENSKRQPFRELFIQQLLWLWIWNRRKKILHDKLMFNRSIEICSLLKRSFRIVIYTFRGIRGWKYKFILFVRCFWRTRKSSNRFPHHQFADRIYAHHNMS